MDRRAFVRLLTAAPLASAAAADLPAPKYRVVSPYAAALEPGMPGPYPGRVASVRSPKCLDATGDVADAGAVREMMARGMCALTGEATAPRGLAALLRARGRRRHQGELRRAPVRGLGARDRGRGRPPAPRGRARPVADLRLRALPEPARRRELRAAPARGRADRRGGSGQPAPGQRRLRSQRPTSRRTSSARRTRAPT